MDSVLLVSRPVRYTAVEDRGWGWLPGLSVVAATGLLLVAAAYNGARSGAAWAEAGRWIGLLVLFAPIAVRMLSAKVSRRERIGLLVVLGLGLYLVRILFSPLEFKFVDEFQHLRSTDDVLLSHHLFLDNPILPISSLYPGLESVASAVSTLSGLPVFDTGLLIIGAARLVMVLGLFLFYEQVSRSAYIAGIASLLYMTNAHYQSLAAMFIYESLALPLTAFVLWTVARSSSPGGGKYVGLKLVSVLGAAAVIVTHHLTGQILVAFLLLWTGLARLIRHRREEQAIVGWTTTLVLVLVLTWLAYVAPGTFEYAGGPLLESVDHVLHWILPPRTDMGSVSLPSGPLIERLFSVAAIGLILLGLLLGLREIWRRYRRLPAAMAIAVGSLSYVGTLALRFSPSGSEITGRAWPFALLFVSFVMATGMAEFSVVRIPQWLTRLGLAIGAILIFVGGITSGWPPYWGRLPGTYKVGGFEASVEPEGVTAAEWVGGNFSRDNRFASDFISAHLLASYGKQSPAFGLGDVFLVEQLGSHELAELNELDVRYLLVDKRLSTALPVAGFYFGFGDVHDRNYTSPPALSALLKFDGLTDVDRVFDSGNIVIYDVRALSHAP